MKNNKVRRELIRQRLKEELENCGKSFKEIAELVGISSSLITQYRNSRKLPSLVNLSKICEVIGADANYILGVTDN